jgi:octopine oxidase subunit A
MRDIIVIGAGPAGMEAARIAADHGAETLLLDEGTGPGGQIYRAVEQPGNPQRRELGQAYASGAALAGAFRASRAEYLPRASVWLVTGAGEVGYSVDSKARLERARHIILAGGALERPMPVPGWTLPGVMMAGGAQILLKESGLAFAGAVFAGTGPLLYLIVHQYITAGIPVKAVIDLTPRGNYLRAVAHLPAALRRAPSLIEGMRWQRGITRTGVDFVRGATGIRILGTEAAEGIEYLKGGKWQRIECKNVFLHQGVAPNLNISLAAGCESHWNPRQACWNISVDEWQRSSVQSISVAGDGGAIAGAIAAAQQGGIAALGALERLGLIDAGKRDALARPGRRILQKELAARPFLDTLFRPADALRVPQDDAVTVCRCEEITAGDIRALVAGGQDSPNQLKSFGRCGMGPCQGRFCGLTVSEMLAGLNRRGVQETGYFRLRSPIKPLLLEELAALEKGPEP